jgi:hypothetical protein
MDGQVKVRGYRIELGEVEAGDWKNMPPSNKPWPAVREDRPGLKRLVGILCAGGKSISTNELRHPLGRSSLPDYMVPSAFVAVTRDCHVRPVARSIARRLPAPDVKRPDLDVALCETQLPRLQEAIAAVWAEPARHRQSWHRRQFLRPGWQLPAQHFQCVAQLESAWLEAAHREALSAPHHPGLCANYLEGGVHMQFPR